MFSSPTCSWNSASCIRISGCSLAPQRMSCRPDSGTRSAKFSSACRPVESMAVIFRSLRIKDRRQIRQTVHNDIEFVGCAKQEGAVDPEDADIGRNFFVLQDMNMSLTNVFGGHF